MCEREHGPIEAGRCLQGLPEVAERRGERVQTMELLPLVYAPGPVVQNRRSQR